MEELPEYTYVIIIAIVAFVIIFGIVITLREPEIGKKFALVLAAIANSVNFIIGGALAKAFELIVWF